MLSMEWFYERMKLVKKFARELDVDSVAVCAPLEFKTACMIYELSKYTEVFAVKLDEFSTKEEAVKWLEERGVKVMRKRDAVKADCFLDCSALLSRVAERSGKDLIKVVELTKTGEEYLKRMSRVRAISIDSSRLKEIESTYATAFGLLEALLKLNIYLTGKKVKIVGFGKVGQGCAEMMRRIGCEIFVWDRDEEKRVKAIFSGYKISEHGNADLVIFCTDSKPSLELVPENAIVANMGAEMFEASGELLKDYGLVKCYKKNGKKYYLLADGYAVNLAIGSGSPIEAMDITFSAAILALNKLREEFYGVIPLPREIEERLLRELSSEIL
ncbi:MAG: NAD(P)-dependent oxidoreductase [Archaeoglobaceae archaeon]|uniref:S-adenosyl-L-homocysteine hydrolase NAD binding domain-containing protein n=1 Tax=Archaeoglobus fulgidus TaxID=2234 RepID=A0A7J3M279_ARCFL